MANEDIIAALQGEREQILQRIAAIDIALEALGGSDGSPLPAFSQRRLQIGDDKLSLLHSYLEQHSTKRSPWVRQSAITAGTGLNSGTVSTGLNLLKQRGEVEEGSKQDRSKTWRLVS